MLIYYTLEDKNMEQASIVDFSDVFNFAKKEYGIEWNPANKIFFGNAFEYNEITSVPLLDKVKGYLSIDEISDNLGISKELLEKRFKTFTNLLNFFSKEEILKLPNNEKSYLITAHYLHTIGAKGNVLISSK
jgi:hypothetical protein